jgi:D-glycero-D-manno-heptose 1,7-bisphosphate phosphatase
MLKPAVFLDRDGVLVRPLIRNNLAYAPLRREDFELLPGGAEAVASLRAAGFVVVVVTNQPEVRRGTLDPALLEEFHQRLRAAVPVDDILTCPHDDRDGCPCRKPKPGMILEAARRHDLDLTRSFLVGDTDKDLGAAQAAGLPFMLIDAPYNKRVEAPLRVPDVAAAARAILSLSYRE